MSSERKREEENEMGKIMNNMHTEVVMRREEERIIWIRKVENVERCLIYLCAFR